MKLLRTFTLINNLAQNRQGNRLGKLKEGSKRLGGKGKLTKVIIIMDIRIFMQLP